MRRFRGLLALALVLCAVIAFALPRSTPNTLIERARLISRDSRVAHGYQWVTHDLVIVGDSRTFEPLSTGDSASDRVLEGKLRDSLANLNPETPFLSPDQKRCLGEPKKQSAFGSYFQLEGPGGTEPKALVPRKTNGLKWTWFPDSSGLVSVENVNRIVELCVFDPETGELLTDARPTMPMYSPLRGFRGGSFGPRPGAFAAKWVAPSPLLLGATPKRTAILTTWRPSQLQDVDLFEVSLSKDIAPIRTHTIPIEPGQRVDSVVLSPDCSRVAMQVYTRSASTPRWIDWLVPAMARNQPARDEIWIVGLDGQNPRMLGAVQTPIHGGQNRAPKVPRDLAWHPSGTRVSFVYDSALYLVNAD